jgi:outer membrane receptor protein involved in Fe transport
MRAAGAAILFVSSVAVAPAAAAEQRQALNLPAGRLGDALAVLGRQAGVSVGLTDPALANARVAAVKGNISVGEALRRLLRGHQATFVVIDPVTFRIVPTKAAKPSPRKAPLPRPERTRATPQPRALPQVAEEPSEIVVVASRRQVPLVSYPGSVSILRNDDLALADGSRGSDALVSRLASLTSTHLGPGRNKLFIRGISESSFNGPTQALVGQYLGETRINYNAPDPDLRLADLERVEVLAGPQGTLYGAGSLGGIIRLVPNAPKLDRVEGSLALGAAHTFHGGSGGDALAVVNVPLVEDRVAARFSGYAVAEPGYIDDSQRQLEDVNSVRILGGRLGLRAVFGPWWTIDLAATGQQIRGNDAQFAERGEKRLTRRSSVRQNYGNDYRTGNIVAAHEREGYRFVATAGVVDQELRERYDATQVFIPPTAYDLTTRVSLFSTEARLSRQGAAGAGWVVGAAYLRNHSDQSREVEQSGVKQLRNRVGNSVSEGALYGEASVEILPNVSAMLGGRLAHARLSSSGFVFVPGFPLPQQPEEASRSQTRFLPAAAISFKPAPSLFVYGRYQESFRPGGLAIARSEFRRFRSDKLRAVELGSRYGGADVGDFDASATVSYTRWSDIQADTIDNFGEPTTVNVGDGRIYTLDVQAGWRPAPGLALNLAAVLNDSKVTNMSPGLFSGGGALAGVAPLSGRLAAGYSAVAPGGIEMRFSAAARYIGRSNLGSGELLRKAQGDWVDISLDMEATSGRYSFNAGVTNLLDTAANRFALGTPFTILSREYVTPVRPRTIRASLGVAF